MRAMILKKLRQPLRAADLPVPDPTPSQVPLKVGACAVCRTDLHVVDGELPKPELPLVPGHEIVGVIVQTGQPVKHLKVGDRVGIPWLGWTCGEYEFFRSGGENLCDRARFAGYTLDGGYTEFVKGRVPLLVRQTEREITKRIQSRKCKTTAKAGK